MASEERNMRSNKAFIRCLPLAAIVVLAVTAGTLLISAEKSEVMTSNSAVGDGVTKAEREVVLYYFHGTHRCNTCRTIEAYAQQAIETKFKDELQNGTLQWKTVNTDESANEHFVKDFALVSSSLVVVEMSGGDVVRHDVLQDAWTLVRDEPRFKQYVQKSVHEYLR
jgi:hypothetical protein